MSECLFCVVGSCQCSLFLSLVGGGGGIVVGLPVSWSVRVVSGVVVVVVVVTDGYCHKKSQYRLSDLVSDAVIVADGYCHEKSQY